MVTIEEQLPAGGEPQAGSLLILPGAGYTAQAPLLFWANKALLSRGWRVLTANWADRPATLKDGRDRVLTLLDQFADTVPDAILAKSIGSFALPWAIEKSIPGVWLTPLLTDPGVATALRQANSRHLAIGGTADPAWQIESLAGSRAVLHSVPDMNHGLERVDDPWAESARRQLPLIEMAVEHITNS